MRATQREINIIANMANVLSDAGERRTAASLGLALFPEQRDEIREAIYQHPINQRWDEYVAAKDKTPFLLPED